MDIEYPGDARMAEFEDRWDFVVRHLRTRFNEADLEGILVKKLRKSELLKTHLDHYDRCPRGHPDRSYRWLCRLIDTVIVDRRDKRNTQSLILQASGKDQAPAKAPANPAKDGGKGDPKGDKKPGKGKGGGKGDGDAKKDKDKGKGKTDKSASSGSESERDGKTTAQIPEDQMCCISHLWGKCTKADCPFAHRDKPTKGIKEHWLYRRNVKKLGPPTGPKKADAKDAAGDAA